jgi:hypothetical protein
MQATNLAIGMHDCAMIGQLELKMLIGVRLLYEMGIGGNGELW